MDNYQIKIKAQFNIESITNKLTDNMKNIAIATIIILSTSTLYSQSCKKRYKNQLEPDSKLVVCEANYTIEKLKESGIIIYKMYYPSTKQITKLVTLKNLESNIKHGLYQENWDDGTVVNKGLYQNNQKQGAWILDTYEHGEFIDDKKTGDWVIMGSDSIISQKETYLDDMLHGVQIMYDSLGNTIMEQHYSYGKLISTTRDTSTKIVEEMPRFPGCEEMKLSLEELTKCSQDKLLAYMNENLKYPRKSRAKNIQGKAIIQFVVDKNGEIIDVKALNGVSDDIKKEALKLVRQMPRWKPGTQGGRPVKVLFTLPIQFRLN